MDHCILGILGILRLFKKSTLKQNHNVLISFCRNSEQLSNSGNWVIQKSTCKKQKVSVRNTSISPFVAKDQIFIIWQKKSRIDGHRVNFQSLTVNLESGTSSNKSVCDGEFSRAFVISSLYGKPTFILLNLTTCRNKLKKKIHLRL